MHQRRHNLHASQFSQLHSRILRHESDIIQNVPILQTHTLITFLKIKRSLVIGWTCEERHLSLATRTLCGLGSGGLRLCITLPSWEQSCTDPSFLSAPSACARQPRMGLGDPNRLPQTHRPGFLLSGHGLSATQQAFVNLGHKQMRNVFWRWCWGKDASFGPPFSFPTLHCGNNSWGQSSHPHGAEGPQTKPRKIR